MQTRRIPVRFLLCNPNQDPRAAERVLRQILLEKLAALSPDCPDGGGRRP